MDEFTFTGDEKLCDGQIIQPTSITCVTSGGVVFFVVAAKTCSKEAR